ncbi:putative phytanoyl- dioxygenase family protein [Eutypa lata UCREL1]|uniref:Putative phytanoyl-dioxygenase family protein n=1 Tax=Eutypa lata (strain UCR-EL1) TaxID=1287681 RepID=M7T683_EUTLA|nr:putative phytanoyl- dioxygenase family protein [Eutypa lata UCREL1]
MAANLDEAKSHLKEHGWARISSVLSKEEASSTLDHLWKAREVAEARGDPTYMPFLDPNSSNMVKSVLGETFLISNFTANIARPGSSSMALHSDQSIVFPEPWHAVWALNIVWCLTDVYEANGATRYIPRSNKWVWKKEVPANAPDLLVPFEAKAGDVIVMDGRVWHTSGSNVTKDQDRALLFGYYTAPFVRQQVNWTAQLPKELQDTLSSEMKEWLGLDPVGNIHTTGDLRYMSQQYPNATNTANKEQTTSV